MNGINLATNTMANWVIRSTDMYLSLIYDRMHELIYDSKVIHADETPVKVMRIDNSFDDLPISDCKKQRQLVLSEKVDAYFAWIKQKYAQVTPNGSIGKALAYSINQEKYLRVFLTDGNIPMDNNYAEQAIRPFTLGRKNFVLIESSNGAKASAVLYSLVETAKANGLNTFEYFNLLLTEIPQHIDESNLRFLDDLLCVLHRTQIAGQSDLSHRKRPPMCGNIFKRGIDRQRRRKIRTRSLRTDTADHIDIDILIRQRDTDDLFEYRKEHVQTCIIHADCGPAREADI